MFRDPISKIGIVAISSALLSLVGCGAADTGTGAGTGVGDQPPISPSELTVEVTNTNRVMLTWRDNSSVEESFLIERRGGPGQVTFVEIADADSDSTTFEDWTVQRTYSYTYRIRASNEAGFSEFSNEEDILVPNQPPDGTPEAPSNLVVVESGGPKGGYILTWDDNADNEEKFVVRRRESTDDPIYSIIATLGEDTETFTDTGIVSGIDYCYIVDAENDNGSASSSEVCTGEPSGIPTT